MMVMEITFDDVDVWMNIVRVNDLNREEPSLHHPMRSISTIDIVPFLFQKNQKSFCTVSPFHTLLSSHIIGE